MEINLSNDEKFWIIFIISSISLVGTTHFIASASFNSFLWLSVILPALLSIIDIGLVFLLKLKRPRLYEKYGLQIFLVLFVIIMTLIYFFHQPLIKEPIDLLFLSVLFFAIWVFVILIVRSILKRGILLLKGLRITPDFDLKRNILIYKKPDDVDDELIYRMVINAIIESLGGKWVNEDGTSHILEIDGDIYRLMIVFYDDNIAILPFKEDFIDLSIDERCKTISKGILYVFKNILKFERATSGESNEITRYSGDVISEYSSRNKLVQTITDSLYRVVRAPSQPITPITVYLTTIIVIILGIFSVFISFYESEMWKPSLEFIENNSAVIIVLISILTFLSTVSMLYLMFKAQK